MKANNTKTKFQSFISFEEMNNADAKLMVTYLPEKHFMNVNVLIKNLYQKELAKPFFKKITFK